MSNFLHRLSQNIAKLQSKDNQTIVVDGKWIGEDIPETMNMVKGTVVSKDEEDAKIQELFEKTKLGKPMGPISDEETNKIIDKYIEELANHLFDGV